MDLVQKVLPCVSLTNSVSQTGRILIWDLSYLLEIKAFVLRPTEAECLWDQK